MSKILIKGEVKTEGHKETIVAMSIDFKTEEDAQDFIREQRRHGNNRRMWVHKTFINGRPLYKAVRRFAEPDAFAGNRYPSLSETIWDGEPFQAWVIPIYTSKLIKEEPPLLE